MELSAEMVTSYPSGDDAGRVRPLRSLLRESAVGGFAKRQYPLSAGWSHWTISTLASFTSHTKPRMVCVRVTLPLTQR